MAKKRMFDNSVIDTDKFRKLGQSAKALYFMLGMDTDQDGFVSFQKQNALHGFEIGDLKMLSDAGFVIVFPSGIVVITDFHLNNHLDKRWYTPTIYQKEFRQLKLLGDKRYIQTDLLETTERPLRELSETTQLEGKDHSENTEQAEQRRDEMSRDGSPRKNTMKTEEGAEKKTERSEEEIKKMRRENNEILKKVEEGLKNIGKMPFAPETVPTVYID